MKIKKFSGIDNINIPERLEPGACVSATNVIFNGLGVARRPGSKRILQDPILSSYGTLDRSQVFYVLPSLDIVRFDGSTHAVVGRVNEAGPCYWAEESPTQVFVAQGDGNIQEWNGVGFSLLDINASGLTAGTKPLAFPGEIIGLGWIAGRLVVCTAVEGFTRVTFSISGVYGRQTLREDWFEIPHRVSFVEAFATNLIVACTDAVFVYNVENGLLIKKLSYGVPLGKPLARYSIDKALLWTTRGLLEYPEFVNKTADRFLSKPGLGCSITTIHFEGNEYAVVGTDGLGINYNVSKK
jgi:hypothetical protein